MPETDASITADLDALLRGAAAVYSREELERKLQKSAATGKPLRVKLGMDPSSPDIHIGHAVVLRQMRRFQDLGHTAVLIIGDYTARIGDPTGKSKTRPMLTPEAIDANAQTYLEQATKILDPDPNKLELRRNSEWLASMTFADVIRLSSKMTVARMLERDTFDTRYKAGQPISLHEFLYPLMQGWDSVCVNADVELGGTDQTFNNLVGRDFQSSEGQEPQVVIVCPILRGLDGVEKMSKSLGNAIGLNDDPNDMFGKTMSIPDGLMREWFELCTNLSGDEIAAMIDPGRTHPRDAKDRLARTIVATYHDETAAAQASDEFRSRFTEGNLPTDLETRSVSESPVKIVNLLALAGFSESNSDARRLVKQGAVSVDDRRIEDYNETVQISGAGIILRVGKRRVCRIVCEGGSSSS